MTHAEQKLCFRLINLYEGLADDIRTNINLSFFRKKNSCVLAVLLFYFSFLETVIILRIEQLIRSCNMHSVFKENKIVSVL